MGSPYTDLQRPPLGEAGLRRALIVEGGLWSGLRVVGETGSTNADLVAAARGGAGHGEVLVAERQIAGKGRLGRVWESPARAGLAVSVLLRPTGVSPSRFGWLSLLAGVALVDAVRKVSEVDAVLKWPNDMLVGSRKCAGILAEAVTNGEVAVVLGVGLNATLRADELPTSDSTSLALEKAVNTDRDTLLRALLRDLAGWYERWYAADGDAQASGVRTEYLGYCATIGQRVAVALPGGAQTIGTAIDVDVDGQLVIVNDAGQRTALAAGDVVHLRRES